MDRPNENHDETFRTIEFLYRSYAPRELDLSGIHEAFLEKDLHKLELWIESGGIVKERENYRCSFALHLAITTNDMKILEYLLARGDIEVNSRYITDEDEMTETPLHLAIKLGHIECVEKLIQAGADVNMTHGYGTTPLHMSVHHPDICHLLIRHGALIDAVDDVGVTALEHAAFDDCLETIYMLLYYNADINKRAGYNSSTPFDSALYRGNVATQEVLYEYVYDFNSTHYMGGSMLISALSTDSPFVKDIIERGVDVNQTLYIENPTPFSACCIYAVNSTTFKLVWEKLRYDRRTVDLFHLVDNQVPTFLPVIIESDNFKPAVEFFSKRDNYFAFVKKFVKNEFDFDHLTAFTCRLLEYGFRASSYDIHAILSNYGYCELFRILLYMDNDYSRGWLPQMALSRLIFDVDYDLESLADQVHKISKEAVSQLLEYSICPRLIDALTLHHSDDKSFSAILSRLPKVPSLIELARNTARKHLWQAFKITNNCQFYTTIDHLNISTVYKDILTFKTKMYMVK